MQAKIKGLRKLGEADIEVKIKGQEFEKLFELARQTNEAMNELAQFTNVYVSMDMTKPEYQIRVDRARAAELGVSVADVATTTTLAGERRGRHPLPRRRRLLQYPGDDSGRTWSPRGRISRA